MNRCSYILSILLLLSACSPSLRVFNSGSIIEKTFTEEIPFTFDYGIPMVSVNIAGKNYRFMFDTGAATVITPEIAKLLHLEGKFSQQVSDSQGTSQQQQYVIIPHLQIGNLNFENIGAVVIAPSDVFEFSCMKYDGIIGSNLMAKAIWQIDYKNKLITATNNIDKLNIPSTAQTIDFIPKKGQKTPLVPVKIGKKITYTTFDTGSNGDFSLSLNTFKDELISFKNAQSTGAGSSGVYGTGKNSITNHVKIPTLELGKIIFENNIIDFSENSSNTLGNLLFKNYNVILNWNENKIYMVKHTEYNYQTLLTFGFMIRYINNKPKVVKIYKNSAAEKQGIQFNDEVINVNGKDLTNLTDDEACFYAFNDILKTAGNSISLTVVRDGKNIDVNLNKTILLN